MTWKFWRWTGRTWRWLVLLTVLIIVTSVITYEVGGIRLQRPPKTDEDGTKLAAVNTAGPAGGMTDFPEEKPVEPPKVQPGSLPGTSPPAATQPAPTQGVRWPRKVTVKFPIVLKENPEDNWFETDLELEPGLAYPVTSKTPPPPGIFDYDLSPRRKDRDLPEFGKFPSDSLCAGRVPHIVPDRPGKFTYLFLPHPKHPYSGTWTFEVDKGIPVNKFPEESVNWRTPTYRNP